MIAEATGVCFYVFPGIAATGVIFTNDTESQFGTLFMIGWADAIGVDFAIVTCAPSFGGHFTPGQPMCMHLLKTPNYNTLLCILARLSVEADSILHLCTDVRKLHSRLGNHGAVPRANR
jgi:glycerol uptake facilitator-like aquaporin